MWLLGFLLLPIVLSSGIERNINHYIVKIEEGTLKSVKPTSESSDVLSLSDLQLRQVDKDAFPDINSITILSLADNELSEIPESGLSKLTSLEHLNLANNSISGFNHAFTGLRNLKSLNITSNPLSELSRGSLFELTNSTNVFVTSNSLRSISTSIFESPIDETTTPRQPTVEEMHKNVFKYDPKKHGPSVYFGPQPPKTTEAPPPPAIRVKVCIQGGIVKSLSALQAGEVLASGCKEVNYDPEEQKVSLQKLDISGFERGWYQLRDSPVIAIDLDGNRITRLTREVLNDLPESVKDVSIKQNNIERLKREVLENGHLTALDLSGNFIEEIEDGAFEKVNAIERLGLNDNRLTTTNFATTLPASITELSLQENDIDNIAIGSLSSLVQLSKLKLDDNNITYVQKGALRGLGPLRHLTLANNRLTGIESGTFEGLDFIRHLDLSNNRMSALQKDLFKGLGILLGLNISGNRFSEITRESMAGLPGMVHYLWLDNNGIESLSAGAFVGAPILDLTLNDNRISTIDKGSFKLGFLRSLGLKNNRLSQINGDSFDGVKSLKKLSLAGNGITKLEKGAAKNWRRLTDLDLSNNPIKELQNGSLYGVSKNFERVINLEDTPLELIQGGVFDDV